MLNDTGATLCFHNSSDVEMTSNMMGHLVI